jgi:hypothetical protein
LTPEDLKEFINEVSTTFESPQALLPRKGRHYHDTHASACQAVS